MIETANLRHARRDELMTLVREDGTLHPRDVVAFARNPDTALHAAFEWDVDAAADAYLLIQAQGLIRAVAKVVAVEGSDEAMRVRAFVSLPRDRASGHYRQLSVVMEDPELRDEALAQAAADFSAFRAKHRHLSALAEFFATADRVFPKAA